MRQKKRSFKFLLISILSLISLAYIIFFIPPTYNLQILDLQLPVLNFFIPLIFLFFFSTGTYLFKNQKNGLLIALFVTIYAIFRLNNLTHPFFLILLAALFITLVLLFTYRR